MMKPWDQPRRMFFFLFKILRTDAAEGGHRAALLGKN